MWSFYLNGEISLWRDLLFQSWHTHSLLRFYYFNPVYSCHLDFLSVRIKVWRVLKLQLIFGFFIECSEKWFFFMKRNAYWILVDTKFNESFFQFAWNNLPILSYSFNHMFNSLIINIGLLGYVRLIQETTTACAMCGIYKGCCWLIWISYLRFKK